MPKGRSREGISMRSLKSRWGEARSGEGVSTRSIGVILLDACLDWFIYTLEFMVVRVKSAFWILIGPESGMLWMLWAQEGPGMLHWGTLSWPAASRLVSSERRIIIGCWPQPGHWVSLLECRIMIGRWPRPGRWASLLGCRISIGCRLTLSPASSVPGRRILIGRWPRLSLLSSEWP